MQEAITPSVVRSIWRDGGDTYHPFHEPPSKVEMAGRSPEKEGMYIVYFAF